jgi:hypothetical protein
MAESEFVPLDPEKIMRATKKEKTGTCITVDHGRKRAHGRPTLTGAVRCQTAIIANIRLFSKISKGMVNSNQNIIDKIFT